jgi:hypothetical protein
LFKKNLRTSAQFILVRSSQGIKIQRPMSLLILDDDERIVAIRNKFACIDFQLMPSLGSGLHIYILGSVS